MADSAILTKSNVPLIYTISISSALFILLSFQAAHLAKRYLKRECRALRKNVLYPLLFIRPRGSSNVTRLEGCYIGIYVGANVTSAVIFITGVDELGTRCGQLFSVNAILVFAGGRTNFLAEYVFGVPLHRYGLFHRWVGRLCVVEGVIHGAITLAGQQGERTAVQMALMPCLIALGVLSILYLRRWLFEVFLKLHLALALALLGLLWVHVGYSNSFSSVCLVVASALLTVQYALWFFFMLLRNCGHGETIVKVVEPPFRAGAYAVQVILKRPCQVTPGDYVYLTILTMASRTYGLPESHPYFITNVELLESGRAMRLELLVEQQSGFSLHLPHAATKPISALIDGPYGGLDLDGYDNLIIVTCGIGIAAYLLAIRHLIRAEKNKTSRIRRITLIWFLESSDQEDWATSILTELIKIDENNITATNLYLPYDFNAKAHCDIVWRNGIQRLAIIWGKLEISNMLSSAERLVAGKTAVCVCGPPAFEGLIIKAVTTQAADMVLYTTSFQSQAPLKTDANTVNPWSRINSTRIPSPAPEVGFPIQFESFGFGRPYSQASTVRDLHSEEA